jgi:hypothetical protein
MENDIDIPDANELRQIEKQKRRDKDFFDGDRYIETHCAKKHKPVHFDKQAFYLKLEEAI